VVPVAAAIVLAGALIGAGLWFSSPRGTGRRGPPPPTFSSPSVPAPTPTPAPATPGAGESKTAPIAAARTPIASAAAGTAKPSADPTPELVRIARAKGDAKLLGRAIADLQGIVRDHPESPAIADAYLLMASFQEQQGQLDEAIATYIELRSRVPARTAEAGFKQAQLMVRTGRPVVARELLTTIASTYPDSEWAPQAVALRSQIEERRQGRQSEQGRSARGGGRGERGADPEQAAWRLAQVHLDSGRLALAEKALTDLVTRFPQTRFDAWWQLGELYGRPALLDRQKALAAYAHVPTTSPRYAEAQLRIRN
jgi:TolA-binding protein